MKPKTNFDPLFHTDLRRRWPIRSIGALTIVLSLSGLALRAGPIPMRRQVSPPLRVAPVPGGQLRVQGNAANPQARSMQPLDRFVIVAPSELDAAMVVRARDDIDPEMVFNPETRRRGLAPNGPAPVIVAPVPGHAPLSVPAPDHARPRR
jgi:hypothetical protein